MIEISGDIMKEPKNYIRVIHGNVAQYDGDSRYFQRIGKGAFAWQNGDTVPLLYRKKSEINGHYIGYAKLKITDDAIDSVCYILDTQFGKMARDRIDSEKRYEFSIHADNVIYKQDEIGRSIVSDGEICEVHFIPRSSDLLHNLEE